MTRILIGFKNCGKSVVGQALALRLAMPLLDTDRLLEERYYSQQASKLRCREIFQKHGEDFFRQLEKEIIAQLAPLTPTIIATGGGSLIVEDNLRHLKKLGSLIYLHCPFALLFRRLSSATLPAYINSEDPYQSFHHHYQQRQHCYSQAADYEIMTENKTIEQIVTEIIHC